MPEIKHHFTKGKMDKDLDERLIPNGEYRDAMNIQVSTSEGSEVGTIQNILGNSLVIGQNFISDTAYCVGSISDEKNDKLYYFVEDNREVLQNITPEPALVQPPTIAQLVTQWTPTGGNIATYIPKDKVIIESSGDPADTQYPLYKHDDVDLVDGRTYEVKTKFKEVDNSSSQDNTKAFVYGVSGGDNSYRPYYDTNVVVGEKVNTFKFDKSLNNNVEKMAFAVELTGGNNVQKRVSAQQLSLAERNSYIIEYDSKTNLITPVVVDTQGDVLKFSRDRLITGINIIDDMLFWTDNYSEPKKINIPRSILGTDSSGLVHTEFINEKTDIYCDIREEHITVIKKKPPRAPKIQLHTGKDPNLNYSGIMRITGRPSIPFTEQSGDAPGLDYSGNPILGDGGNYNNTSSFWLNDADLLNHYYDWSQFVVGSEFRTRIETDLNGNSGFTLDWAVGDILHFKPFGGVNFSETPSVPITDFTIKAEILPDPSSGPVNNFSDEQTELSPPWNIPDSDGNFPQGWTDNASSTQISWNINEEKMSFNVAAGAYRKLYTGSYNNFNANIFVKGGNYRFSFDVEDVPATGGGFVTGNLVVSNSIMNPNSSTVGVWIYRIKALANGHYEQDFEIIEANSIFSYVYTGWNAFQNKILFQTGNSSNGFIGAIKNVSVIRLDASDAQVRCKILGINGTPPVVPSNLSEMKYAVDKFMDSDKLFEFKFPRIAYRYKYQDGEYSAISPFSEVCFLPGSFDYHPKKGYNLGMVNRITKITVSDFKQNIYETGVSEIDIIYKDDASTNLYIVDTIKPQHASTSNTSGNHWDENEYIIESEQINRAIESNQLLRPWDNVPKKALAQEVSGSRIIYGNYTQGYDLVTQNGSDYYPNFSLQNEFTNVGSNTESSIKSLREYQIGALFVDKYGRETPVVSNKTGTTKIEKIYADKKNTFAVSFNDINPPENLDYFKFFVKEPSGEYYNLAMDRHFDAEDGQIWLSFPSSDINKVVIDDFIILKKGLESSDLIEDTTKYKVLDIQENAPEFIKMKKFLIEEITHRITSTTGTPDNLFGTTLIDVPLEGLNTFKTFYEPFNAGSSAKMHTWDEFLWIEFVDTVTKVASKRYQISSISEDSYQNTGGLPAVKYTFRLVKKLGDDVNFITDDASGYSPTKIREGVALRVYKYIPKNSAQFDGRFFAKININQSVNSNIILASQLEVDTEPEYRGLAAKKMYSIRGDHEDTHGQKWTGMKAGVYADRGDQNSDTDPNFIQGMGPWACYFRNYNKRKDEFTMKRQGYSSAGDVGQYAFGPKLPDIASPGDADWVDELAWITAYTYFTRGYSGGIGNVFNDDHFMACGSNIASSADTKRADDNGESYENPRRGEHAIWFINEGPRRGKVSNNHLGDKMDFQWDRVSDDVTTASNGVNANHNNEDFSLWSINIGGIFHEDSMRQDHLTEIENFWNVGKDGGNPSYSGGTSSIVEKLSGGVSFRWKEDPNNNVYTIKNLESENGHVRWATPYSGPLHGGSGSGAVDYPNEFGSYKGHQPGTDSYDNREVAAQLSPNFSQEWKVSAIDKNNEGNVPWNPTGSLGPINTGLELTISAAIAGTVTGDDPKVYVASLQATNTIDGEIHTLQEGMILTSHSNGGTTYNSAQGLEELLIWKIEKDSSIDRWNIHLTGYRTPMCKEPIPNIPGTYAHNFYTTQPASGQNMVFRQPKMNGYNQYSCNRINQHIRWTNNMTNTGYYDVSSYITAEHDDSRIPRIMPVCYTFQFVEEIEKEPGMPVNPAVWETEPKETQELDIYYEASGYNPMVLSEENKHIAIPLASTVVPYGNTFESVFANSEVKVTQVEQSSAYSPLWYIRFDSTIFYGNIAGNSYLQPNDELKITKPDGSSIIVSVVSPSGFTWNYNTVPRNYVYVDPNQYNNTYILSWHNCFAFGNGVESDRIRDNFNLPFISNGVKASTTIPFPSDGEEHRKYGLIYSGLYNSISGVNNLNQFISAEKITKDINPIYGSIQKLHSRDTDLVTLCEDKVLKILANKDAVFNADGNPQLTANQNVLGQTVPFVGEYGISKNPESFASEAYRAYFTDRVRGTVMRLSKDGLTPISDHGMKDWFRDNLSLGVTNLLGENNLASEDNWDIAGNFRIINGEAILGYYNDQPGHPKFGKPSSMRMHNVLEIGKTYRLQFDVVEHSGYQKYSQNSGEYQSITINNSPPGTWQGVSGMTNSDTDGAYVNVTWVAERTTFDLLQYQVTTTDSSTGFRMYDGVTITNFMANLGVTWGNTHAYLGIVKIKNIIVQEVVKEDLKIIGSYDDRQDEYNVTIHGEDLNTVSFREDIRGWVSFKSFIPENGLSCANDYYTLKNGKLWQHHVPGINRNTFYNEFTNSTFNAILNDAPSSIKSYHTLEYEGSQSRIEGIRTCVITGVEHVFGASVDGRYAFFELSDLSAVFNEDVYQNNGNYLIKQYRDDTLIYEGYIRAWVNIGNTLTSPSGGPTKGHLRRNATVNTSDTSNSNPGDFEVGDIITTQLQEDSVDHFNSTSTDGWYVSGVKTNNEEGSLLEFIKKEGKWFNYIKGINTISTNDELNDYSNVDFGSFDIQGLGIIENISNNNITISGDLNTSIQIGDVVYYEKPTQVLGDDLLENITDADWNIYGGSGTQWTVNSGVFQAGTNPDYGYARADVPGIIQGKEYEIKYTITTGASGQFILANHGIGGANIHLEENVATYTKRWTQGSSNVGKISLYNDGLFDGTIENISVRQLITGGMLGFTRLDSNQLEKAGVVTNISNNTITLDDSGALPMKNDYCLFVKNQVVNMNGLSGYYADIMFENNSKQKAELFAVSSEITESSK